MMKPQESIFKKGKLFMRFFFFFFLFLAGFSQAMEKLSVIRVKVALCVAKKTVQAKPGDEFQAITDPVQKKAEYQAPRESLLKRDKSWYDSEKSSDGERLTTISPDSSHESTSSGESYFERHYPFSAHGMAIPISEDGSEFAFIPVDPASCQDSESESLAEAAKKISPHSR